MDEKRDWRKSGAQIEQERAALKATIEAIPDSMTATDIKNAIRDGITGGIANDQKLALYISEMSREEARGLLGEIRWLKQRRQK